MNERVVFLMRGLPSCGKSYTARRLAGETGVVLETDEFFWVQRDDGTRQFQFRKELLAEARRWNFERFRRALAERRSPVVVDRGNGLNEESRQYASYAVAQGYKVEMREPESTWWAEIRKLLRDKNANRQALCDWALRLAELSRATHRVPAETIERWMAAWVSDLSVETLIQTAPGSACRSNEIDRVNPSRPAPEELTAIPRTATESARHGSAAAADQERTGLETDGFWLTYDDVHRYDAF